MIVLFGLKTKENGGNPDNRDKLTLSKGDIKLSKGFRVGQLSSIPECHFSLCFLISAKINLDV